MSEISKTQSIKFHNQNAKNLQEKQELELDKMRLTHKAQKQDLKFQQEKEFINLRNQLDHKLMVETANNERKLMKVKDSLEQVKQQTEKEKQNLAYSLRAKTENQKEQFNNLFNARAQQQKLQLQDLEDSYNFEIRKLQRDLKNKEAEIKSTGSDKLRTVQAQNKENIQNEQDIFRIKKDGLDTVHHNQLTTQEKKHKQYLAKQERLFQDKSVQRQEVFDDIVKKVEADGRGRQMTKQKLFEKKYNQLNEKHTQKITALSKNKEKIINNLKNEILNKHILNFEKTRDPFYTKTTIEPNLTKLPNRDFELKLKIPKEQVEHLTISAVNKEIKLSFNRRFQNVKENADGTTDKINKVETIVKNIKVDEILDSKKLSKSYKDGVLTVQIKRA